MITRSVVAVSYLVARFAIAASGATDEAESKVLERQTFIYEQPDATSGVLRKLYVGEVVKTGAKVESIDGGRWVRVALGNEKVGYVRESKLGPVSSQVVETWKPPVYVRDERPFVVGLRVGGETLGAGVNIRYQPFTRLGISLNTGSVIDLKAPGGAVGPTLGIGIYSAFLLYDFSPVIELGVMSSKYSSTGAAALQLTNFYVTAGIEWMFQFGLFVHVYAAYVRGIGMSLTLPVDSLDGAMLEKPSFGWLDESVKSRSFSYFFPGITVGYAF